MPGTRETQLHEGPVEQMSDARGPGSDPLRYNVRLSGSPAPDLSGPGYPDVGRGRWRGDGATHRAHSD